MPGLCHVLGRDLDVQLAGEAQLASSCVHEQATLLTDVAGQYVDGRVWLGSWKPARVLNRTNLIGLKLDGCHGRTRNEGKCRDIHKS